MNIYSAETRNNLQAKDRSKLPRDWQALLEYGPSWFTAVGLLLFSLSQTNQVIFHLLKHILASFLRKRPRRTQDELDPDERRKRFLERNR